jgi:hypothetical protein
LLRLQLTEVLADVHVEAGKEGGKEGGRKGGPGGKALKTFLFALREALLGMESGVSGIGRKEGRGGREGRGET